MELPDRHFFNHNFDIANNMTESEIESLLEAERPAFEELSYRRYLVKRQEGVMVLDTVDPVSIGGLCWRNSDGSYGVDGINAAWWGWRARAMWQILYAEGLKHAPDA